jgi:hypothetical protein
VRQVHGDGLGGRSGRVSQPLATDRDYSGTNDEPVRLKVMGAVNVIVWDEVAKARANSLGFPHPKNWRVPQPILARPEPIDELRTFKGHVPSWQARIVLMWTFNEGKQVTPSKTEQWALDPILAYMTGAAFIFDSFTVPDCQRHSWRACCLRHLRTRRSILSPPNTQSPTVCQLF